MHFFQQCIHSCTTAKETGMCSAIVISWLFPRLVGFLVCNSGQDLQLGNLKAIFSNKEMANTPVRAICPAATEFVTLPEKWRFCCHLLILFIVMNPESHSFDVAISVALAMFSKSSSHWGYFMTSLITLTEMLSVCRSLHSFSIFHVSHHRLNFP